ncbi:MAG: HlyD family type I secretion periplasmic adaptor subunit [Nisaea sp.]
MSTLADCRTGKFDAGPRIGFIGLSALSAISLFLIGAMLWSWLVPINAAVLAEGRVLVQSYKKTVQSRDGGRILRLLISEGDSVTLGQPLLRFDPSEAWTEHDTTRNQLMQVRGREARLSAALRGADKPDWPSALTGNATDADAQRVMQIEQTLFTPAREEQKGKELVLARRIAEIEEEVRSLEAQVQSTNRQLPMIEEEAADVSTLLSKGLERKPRLLALKRAREALLGQRNTLRSKIAQAEENLAAARLNLLAFRSQSQTELAESLTRTSNEIATLRQKLKSARDRLRNTEIRAPASGEIVDLAFHTIGGVVQPGEPILSIVPRQDELVVDARVRAADIDAVYRGQLAEIRIRSHRWRDRPPLHARVVRISADLLEDEKTGQPFYEARLRLDSSNGQSAAISALKVGMAADIALLTEARTATDYVLGPISQILFRGFRED